MKTLLEELQQGSTPWVLPFISRRVLRVELLPVATLEPVPSGGGDASDDVIDAEFTETK